MAATAETLSTHDTQSLPSVPDMSWLPETFVAPEMVTDYEVRLRAGQFIGKAVTQGSVYTESLPVEHPIESLHEAITRAYEGDEVARQLVEINVRTDVVERTIKTGHVMKKVPLEVTEEGKIVQHGQVMDSIQANSLRFAAADPIMRARTEAETRNAFRTEQYYQDGLFDHYSLLVISRAENLPDKGFFTETMSCSLQLTNKTEDGLALESAFVSGVAVEGELPHDEATVIALGELLGADFQGLSPAEIIDTPILIRNDLVADGVIDVVKLWDSVSGTFFGEDRPSQDYQHYLEYCHEREAAFQPKVEQITHELITAAPDIKSPLDAVRLLNDLAGVHMVEQAIHDKTIDSRVFGYKAAGYIDAARIAYIRGDFTKVEVFQRKAERTETSSSCPSALKDVVGLFGEDGESGSSKMDDVGDCEFMSGECPECHAKNVKTKVQKLRSTGKKRISGSCGCVKITS